MEEDTSQNITSNSGRPSEFKIKGIAIGFAVALCLTSATVLLCSAVSLLAFKRTRATPKTAKFLSIALLTFDSLATFCIIMKRATYHSLNLTFTFQFLALGWSFLSYITIAVMSVERLIIFQWPNLYLRWYSVKNTGTIGIVIWLIYIIPYVSFFGRCALNSSGVAFGFCLIRLAVFYIQFTFPLVALICCFCFCQITFIVCKQTNKVSKYKSGGLKQNKSTIAVFICVVINLMTAALYTLFTTAIEIPGEMRGLILDILIVFNELADTCAYVLWYKETRLELVKMMAICFPSLDQMAQRMKIEIFKIITYNRHDETGV